MVGNILHALALLYWIPMVVNLVFACFARERAEEISLGEVVFVFCPIINLVMTMMAAFALVFFLVRKYC